MMVSSTLLDPMSVVLENGLIFGIASSEQVFLNFGMASPCFLLKISVFVLKVAFGWWLVAGGCLKEVSSMKQQIHAQTFEPVMRSFSRGVSDLRVRKERERERERKREERGEINRLEFRI